MKKDYKAEFEHDYKYAVNEDSFRKMIRNLGDGTDISDILEELKACCQGMFDCGFEHGKKSND